MYLSSRVTREVRRRQVTSVERAMQLLPLAPSPRHTRMAIRILGSPFDGISWAQWSSAQEASTLRAALAIVLIPATNPSSSTSNLG